MKNAIEIQDLYKSYSRGEPVLKGLNLNVPTGSVYGLLGRNGSGKTTCLRSVMGLIKTEGGRAHIHGADMWNATRSERARVAYVSQDLRLFPDLTLGEHLTYIESLYGAVDHRRVTDLLERFDLNPEKLIPVMSGGQQRLSAILLALCSPAEVLIFDEPTAGLDPLARRCFMEACSMRLADQPDTTILLSTHLLSDIERLATHVAFLRNGVIERNENLIELQEHTHRYQVIFPPAGPPPDIRIPEKLLSRIEGQVLQFVSEPDTADFIQAIHAHPEIRVQQFPLNLEELFLEWANELQTGEQA